MGKERLMVFKNEGNCILRSFGIDDIEKKVEWINNPHNNAYLHYDIPLSYEKTKKWFLNKDNDHRIDCIIEYKGIPVGVIGLLNIDKNNKKAEYYITVGETEYKHKGIATTSTRMILAYAFKNLGLHKVYLNVDELNQAACQLYEKIGFVCEGKFKDDLIHNNRFIDRRRYAYFNEND